MKRGTVLARLLPQQSPSHAIGYLPQSSLDRIDVTQSVWLEPHNRAADGLWGKIVSISQSPIVDFPEALKRQQLIPQKSVHVEAFQPTEPWFELRIELDAQQPQRAGPLIDQALADAHFYPPPESMAVWLWRQLQMLFTTQRSQ